MNQLPEMKTTLLPDLEQLIPLALSLGASEAKIISSKEIIVEERLAGLCQEPRCLNYGRSASCPPHVEGPSAFRTLQRSLRRAVVVRLVIPSSALFSEERRGIMRLLHEIVSGVEQKAIKIGWIGSKAFAGGSCKQIFCDEFEACQVLSDSGECRNQDQARPSMSGFGINVTELMKTCGWPADIRTDQAEAIKDPLSWVAGLVLIG